MVAPHKAEGERFKALHQGMGISQTELSRITGINLKSIQNYDQGVYSIGNITYENIGKIAKGLNMTSDELIKTVKGETK